MIVADANLVAYFVIPGVSTQQAERVRAKDKLWIVPPLLPHELLNIMTTYVNRNRLGRDEAIRAYRRGLALVKVSDVSHDPIAILNLATTARCASYDAEYVWLAQQLRVPMVTADREVIEAFPSVALGLDQFAQ
jgi:predicted nucleic acid-binding protein